MRAGRHRLDAPAHARYAASCRSGRAGSRRLFARQPGRLARCRDHRSPFRARRRAGMRTDFPRPAAEAARRRNPDAGGGRASLSRPDRCARPAASRRLGRSGRSAEPRRYRTHVAAHRQLSLSSSHSRHHALAAALRRGRQPGARYAGPHDERTHFVVFCAHCAAQRTGGSGAKCRHRHRARPAPRGRDARRGCAGHADRPIHEQAADRRFRRTPSSITPSAA